MATQGHETLCCFGLKSLLLTVPRARPDSEELLEPTAFREKRWAPLVPILLSARRHLGRPVTSARLPVH